MPDLERKLSDMQRDALVQLREKNCGAWVFHHMTTRSLLKRALAERDGDMLTLTFDGREVASCIMKNDDV